MQIIGKNSATVEGIDGKSNLSIIYSSCVIVQSQVMEVCTDVHSVSVGFVVVFCVKVDHSV